MKPNSITDIQLQVASTDKHFAGILELQHRNLYKLLDAEQQEAEGFVFVEHNLELLKKMAIYLPQVIALFDSSVIGYNLAMTASMQDELESLIPMFDEFKKCSYRGKTLSEYQYIVGGQICVDKAFRGHGY